jgi:hypothetical protein
MVMDVVGNIRMSGLLEKGCLNVNRLQEGIYILQVEGKQPVPFIKL